MLRWKGLMSGILVFVAAAVFGSCEGPARPAGTGQVAGTPKFEIQQRSIEPVLWAEKPWEAFRVVGANVIREGNLWRMWYGAFARGTSHDEEGFCCYAESPDGLHWTKPNLGLVEFQGNKNNNILIYPPERDGMTPVHFFLDEGKGANEKYKVVAIRLNKKEAEPWWVYGGSSADGIHWNFNQKPICPKNSDTQTVCIPDGKKYRLYTRIWRGGLNEKGIRTIGYTESDHFGDFPDPVEIMGPDSQDPPDLHFYTNAATKLNDHLYVMFPAGFYTKDQSVRSHLAWSRDGVHFTRYGREPVVNIGPKFDKIGVYVVPGPIPGDKPNTWWFYYFATNEEHDSSVKLGKPYDGGIGRFLLVVQDE
jgi:hypothetical protein